MKLSASGLLSEEKFWDIIENTIENNISLDRQGELLEIALLQLTEDEILGYQYHFYKFSSQSYKECLWAVAYIVMGGCGDDGFDDFRRWLITRGKQLYCKALSNPDSLCDEFTKIPAGDIPSFEDAAYYPAKIFETKFGKDLHTEEDKYDYEAVLKIPEIEFTWNDNDEDSIRKICPNTFDKWWGNRRF